MRISQIFAGPYDDGPRARLFEQVAGAFALPDELRQQLILAQRPGWERLADFGRPTLALPYRRLLDRTAWIARSRRALADELALFKPDLIAVWGAEAAARLPARCDAATVGIAGEADDAVALRRCRYLVALSPEIARRAVERGWPEERLRPLPLFAEGDLVEPLPRGALATAEAATVVALPFALNLEALGEVLLAARRLPLPTLWIPGGSRRQSRLALRLQVPLRELGPDVDRARALAAADLVLCSAEADGLGLGIVEGWARGKPVVAAGAPGASGLVRDAGNGILARSTGAADLAEALLRPLDDPLLYDRLAAEGRASFDAGHAEARSLARWLDAYVRLGGLVLPDSPAARETAGPSHRAAQPDHTDIQV
ncbi:MAG: glycosyltransferase [Tistlia sp.]|uniref:glycosyltransferase n=1 Tax=Tistlia sp. TaxID=3057121 RepID=UPI0034A47CD9